MVLPLKYESYVWPSVVVMSASWARSPTTRLFSYVISASNRTQRRHKMQRSSSKTMKLPMSTALRFFIFGTLKRLMSGPYLNVLSCSGHSPPLSHTGQSSGWLSSKNSMTPCRKCLMSGVSVSTTIPSVAFIVHAVTGLRCPSTSTRHMRQTPTGSSLWWWQNTGISTPACCRRLHQAHSFRNFDFYPVNRHFDELAHALRTSCGCSAKQARP